MGFTNFTASFPGSLLAESDIGLLDNRANFTLDGSITSGATSLTVNEDTSSAPTNGVFTIENERILYTSKDDGTKTFSGLIRGYDGSTANSHDDGATVHMNVIAGHHNRLTKELIALQGEVGATGSQNFVRADGTEPLTANWGVGGFDVTNVGTSQADTFEVINAGAGTNPTLTSNAAGDQTSLSGDFSLGGTNLILTQATADYTVTWADPSSARTLTIDDPGANVDFTFRAADLTAGSVPFSDANGNLIQDNANLFWDDTNNRLGLGGTTTPTHTLDLRGDFHLEEYVDWSEIAEPSSPAGDDFRVWAEDTQALTTLHAKDSGGFTFQFAQDNILIARNETGSTITEGSPVYISGGNSGFPTIALAKADSRSTLPAVGVAAEDISDLSFGRVMTYGILRGFDTSSFSVGDQVFVSASTGGTLTATEPSAPNVSQRIGIVVTSAVNGDLEIDTQSIMHGQFTAGSVIFANGSNLLTEDNANLSYDNGTNTFDAANITEGGTPVVLETRTLTGGTGIQTIGDLSLDRTVAVDQSFAPTWTGLHTFNGGVVRQATSITGDGTSDTLTTGQYYAFVDSSSATHTVNLPASPSTGQEHVVKRNGANTVTVSGNGSNIDGAATQDLLNDDDSLTVAWSGTEWQIV